jgi:hypothetical protein
VGLVDVGLHLGRPQEGIVDVGVDGVGVVDVDGVGPARRDFLHRLVSVEEAGGEVGLGIDGLEGGQEEEEVEAQVPPRFDRPLPAGSRETTETRPRPSFHQDGGRLSGLLR